MFPHYIAYNFLFAELLKRFVYVQDLPYFLFPVLIPLVIHQLAGHFFRGFARLLPVAVFIMSPWFWYLYDAQSLYVVILFLTLVATEGIILIPKGRLGLGSIYFILASLMLTYFSSLFLLLIPAFVLVLLMAKITRFDDIKFSVIVLTVLLIPLIFLISQNRSILKYKYDNEISLFRDPGLVNSVNRYQGAAQEEGLRYLSKLSQNKYLFYAEYSALKYVSQLIPVTFFAPQYKFLGFSFSPPIFVGFIIPFSYGLYKLLQTTKARKYLFLSTLLVIPSVLGHDMVSINRLVLFLPVLVIIITYGLTHLHKKGARVFLGLTIILVLFQLLVTILDIKDREPVRSKTYFGKRYTQIEP